MQDKNQAEVYLALHHSYVTLDFFLASSDKLKCHFQLV